MYDAGQQSVTMYRSPVTRWTLTLVGAATGLVMIFGDHEKWRTAPSLKWIGHVPVDLSFWGVLFIIYALLLIPRRTRPVGFAAGAVLFAVFAVSLLATLNTEGPKNAVVIGAVIDLSVFHMYGFKTALAADALERGD